MTYESLKLFGLDHLGVDADKSYCDYNPNTYNHTITLYLIKDTNLCCENCGSYSISVKGTRVNKIRYSYGEFKNVLVFLHKRIYLCLDCKKSFPQKNPLCTHKNNLAMSKELAIIGALRDKNKTFNSVAKDFNVSTTTVMNLFDSWVDLPRNNLPPVLCIDEVYSKKLTYRSYCCVLYSPQRRLIIDILPSRLKYEIIDYFAKITDKEKGYVKYISMDLWDSYRQMAKLCLPNAKICADPFHVIKHLCDAFKKIRIKVMKSLIHLRDEGHNYYWLLKKYQGFLMTDVSNLPETITIRHSQMIMTKYQVIEEMLKLSPELKLAYELKEEYRNFNSTATIDNAQEWLDELILKFKNSHIKEYVPFWSLLQNWHDEIIYSFNTINGHRISNGPMERVNRDIKNIFGISFGCSNFPRTRNHIMFSLNMNAPILSAKK